MRIRVPRPRQRRRLGFDEPRRAPVITPETVWYALLSLASVAAIIGGVVSAAAVSPAFCSVCHVGAVKALAESPHAGTRCDACHLGGGPLGVPEQRLRVVSMVVATPLVIIRGSGPGVTTTDNDGCLECHESEMSATATSRGITMNHRAPLKERWLCVRCHAGAAHPGERYSGRSYSMDTCLACHNANPQNVTTCGVCHPPDEKPDVKHATPWSVTHGASWRTAHGMGDLSTCKTCHSAGYCRACHGMDLPHPDNYLAAHGRDVLQSESGEQTCVVCHKGAACDNCHGVEMPHPASFTKEHPTLVGEKGDEVCKRCHDESACDTCHTGHVHPGIPEDLLEKLKARPVTP